MDINLQVFIASELIYDITSRLLRKLGHLLGKKEEEDKSEQFYIQRYNLGMGTISEVSHLIAVK